MAYAFVPEDGTGLPNASSYVTADEADDYYAADANFATTWAALSDDRKEQFMIWATRILDQKSTWRGQATSTTQALAWPRSWVRDREGNLIDDDEIPEPVKAATLELVKFLQSNDPTTGPDTSSLKSIKVDVIEIAYQAKAVETVYPSIINQILDPIGVMRVGGTSFGRIVKA